MVTYFENNSDHFANHFAYKNADVGANTLPYVSKYIAIFWKKLQSFCPLQSFYQATIAF